MHLSIGNIFQAPAGERSAEPGAPLAEQFVSLLQTPALRLEQIVSYGQATPAGQWYEQADPEWVLLLCGEAQLLFADASTQTLMAGDYLLIPARLRHRVESCSVDARWLALHFAASGNLAP
jgi:cupin 2 domain-containing protein